MVHLCEEQSHIPPSKCDSEGLPSCPCGGQVGTFHRASAASQGKQAEPGPPPGVSFEVCLDSKEVASGEITGTLLSSPAGHSPA